MTKLKVNDNIKNVKEEKMEERTRELVKKDTLCSNNLLVKHFLSTLKRKLKKEGIVSTEVFDLINDGLEVLRVMKRQGQKIEDRCRLYRRNIELCGFKRVKNKKVKEK